jgi:predicted protein tyrosine phosphatase
VYVKKSFLLCEYTSTQVLEKMSSATNAHWGDKMYRVNQIYEFSHGSKLFLTSKAGAMAYVASHPTTRDAPCSVLSLLCEETKFTETELTQLTPKIKEHKYIIIEDDWDAEEEMYAQFPECVKWLVDQLAIPNHTVIVHCYAGVSRSATIIMAYLIQVAELTVTAAMVYVRLRRSIINPNSGFVNALKRWDLLCKEKRDLL